MRRTVVPMPTKQKSHAALELAMTMAGNERGEMHLLTVCSDGEHSERNDVDAVFLNGTIPPPR
jgi:hypothetical protein